MKLLDLSAKLLWQVDENGAFREDCPDLKAAQGLMFLCPKCFAENGNDHHGVHSVICWFKDRGVSGLLAPGPGRWEFFGTAVFNITLIPSVQVGDPCRWHGYIRNGQAVGA